MDQQYAAYYMAYFLKYKVSEKHFFQELNTFRLSMIQIFPDIKINVRIIVIPHQLHILCLKIFVVRKILKFDVKIIFNKNLTFTNLWIESWVQSQGTDHKTNCDLIPHFKKQF